MSLIPIIGPSVLAETVSFFGSTTSTSNSINLPASIEAGDLIILQEYGAGASPPSDQTPTGFTQIITATVSVIRHSISYKISDGTDGGATVNTGLNGASVNAKIASVFRCDVPINSINLSAVANETIAGNPGTATAAASGGNVPLVVFGFSVRDGSGSPTLTPSEDASITASTAATFYKIYNSSPMDHDLDMGDTGAFNSLIAFYAELS